MVKDYREIGLHHYVFKGDRGSIYGAATWGYPIGAMLRNISYIGFAEPNGGPLVGFGWIDEWGHAYVYTTPFNDESTASEDNVDFGETPGNVLDGEANYPSEHSVSVDTSPIRPDENPQNKDANVLGAD